MKIQPNTLSSALIYGIEPDIKYFQKLGSKVLDILKLPIVRAKNFINRVVNGGKELIKNFLSGKLPKLFGKWAKENPIAAGAGVVGLGLGLGTILIVGGSTVGILAGGVGALGAIGSAIGAIGAGALKLGSVAVTGLGITSLLTGQSAGQLISGAFNFAETIYSFDFQQSDKSIQQEIDNTINSLYGPTGEYLGRSIASVLAGGLFNPPRIQINIRALSLAWNLNPDIRDDLLNEVTTLAHLGLTAFRTIVIKQAFMRGRDGIKRFWKGLPSSITRSFPELSRTIENWGKEGNKPWTIQGVIEKRIENLDDTKLEALAEGFIEGFWEQFRQSVEYVYI